MSLSVDLELERGGFALRAAFELSAPATALIGPSGSGKTTLLHAVAGLLRPSRGRVRIGGDVLCDMERGTWLPPWRRRVGLVFQDLRLFAHRTVRENLEYGRAPDGPEWSELVEALDLPRLLERRPDRLSGGERQRVALGRALLAAPRLLLLDEPLAAVDVGLRRQILPYLHWVLERTGVPMLYVSHSLSDVLELTEQAVLLQDGRVRGQGDVFEVLERTLYGGAAGEPFEADSVLRVTVRYPGEDGSFLAAHVGGLEVTLPFARLSGGTVTRVAVRPEDVMLSRERLQGVSARNQLPGTVRRITGIHGRRLVHVVLGNGAREGGEGGVLRAEITQAALGELGLEVGARVWCVVKTSAFRWLR